MRSPLACADTFFERRQDLLLLLFRLVLGSMFMWHGFPKLTGGIETWVKLGATMKVLGITFAPSLWGFMPAIIEFGGGLLLFLGLFYRLAAFFLFSNMMMAFSIQMLSGAGLFKAAQSLEDGFSFVAALGVGPGKYSLDHYLFGK